MRPKARPRDKAVLAALDTFDDSGCTMDELDAVLPVYVDYLGRFEADGHVLEAADVMRELLDRGVQEDHFLPNGELTIASTQIILRDNRAMAVAERFELDRISDPVAFISKNQQDPGSGFSRVVIFTEKEAGHFKGNPVFHAVQCLDSDPMELVESMRNALSRRAGFSRQNSMDSNWLMSGTDSVRSATVRRGRISPFSQTPTPTPQSRFQPVAVASPVAPDRLAPKNADDFFGLSKPNVQYVTADPTQKNIILLNACIADIERFCADVRAMKDREGPAGRRLDDLKATDFVNIFQKFKLAFNLLACLEGHIHDPEAAELLHHLFPPLAFLVDECFDLFGEDLVRDVVAPLPTTRSVRMMSKHLTEREQVIWKALGDYWQKPTPSWEGDIPPYRPIFGDGWAPGVVTVPDDDEEKPASSIKRRDSDRAKAANARKVSSNSDRNSLEDIVFRPPVGGSHDDFRDELMSKNARIALVTFSRERTNIRELTVTKGEYLQVLDADKQWWKCRNKEGEQGFVPHTLLTAILYSETFNGISTSQDNLRNVEKKKTRRSTRSRSSSSEDDAATRRRNRASPTPSLPPPAPPPMPPPTWNQQPAPIKPNHNASNRSTLSGRPPSTNGQMHEELKSVLDLFKLQKSKPPQLDIRTTPNIYISQDSTPSEVRNWLKEKHFSKRVLDETSGLNGGQLLAMTKHELIAAFGKEEGSRLDSQITISRNSTNFKTARSSELKKILEKVREAQEQEEIQD